MLGPPDMEDTLASSNVVSLVARPQADDKLLFGCIAVRRTYVYPGFPFQELSTSRERIGVEVERFLR